MNSTRFYNEKIISTLFITAALSLFVTFNALAQDTIYLKSAPPINAKILEVNPSNIKYKSYSNMEGPTYTLEKRKIEKVVYENGDVENYSPAKVSTNKVESKGSDDLVAGSKLFLTYSYTEGKRNVPGKDATKMLRTYIRGKTHCTVVRSIEEADFVIELSLIKKFLSKRSAMIVVKHAQTDNEVFKSKWVKSSSSVFYGLSGSRAAIGKLVKEHLLKEYPNI